MAVPTSVQLEPELAPAGRIPPAYCPPSSSREQGASGEAQRTRSRIKEEEEKPSGGGEREIECKSDRQRGGGGESALEILRVADKTRKSGKKRIK